MARIKKSKTKIDTSTKKSKSTECIKNMNEKVRKLRINMKNSLRKGKEINGNALQVQCKDENKGNTFNNTQTLDKFEKSKYFLRSLKSKRLIGKVVNNISAKSANLQDKSINNSTELISEKRCLATKTTEKEKSNSLERLNKNHIRKCIVKLQKIEKLCRNINMVENPKGEKRIEKEFTVKLAKIPTMKSEKLLSTANREHISARVEKIVCVIDNSVAGAKTLKSRNKMEAVKCFEQKPNIDSNLLEKEGKQSQSNCLVFAPTRKCFVKLQKLPAIKHENNNLIQTPDLNNVKDCVVKLKKIGHSDLVSSSVSCTPIRNNIQYNTLHILSSTKSLKNITEKENGQVNCVNDHVGVIQDKKANDKKSVATSNELYIRSDELSGIKLMPRLSLKKRDIRAAKDSITFENNPFESHEECGMLLENDENSNALSLTKSKHQENSKEINILSKNRTSIRNFANKSDEIENVLTLLDDEEIQNENDCVIIENNFNITKEIHSNIPIPNNRRKKIFNNKNNTLRELVPQKVIPPEVKKRFKDRILYKKRLTKVQPTNIYDFMSQSQNSDSNIEKKLDPTADIVQKLIHEGKVRVATNCKGKGKPKFKRIKPESKRIKKNKTSFKVKQLKNNIKKGEFKTETENVELADHYLEDHFDNDDQIFEFQKDISIGSNHKEKNFTNEHEGTVRSLARSVMLRQAVCSGFQNINSSRTFAIGLNSTSTPKNNKISSPQIPLETKLSPIAIAPSRTACNASPWRISQNVHLPTTFNFNRSSGNLPSFSSDFIPPTPRKKKPNMSQAELPVRQPLKKPTDGEKIQLEKSNISEQPALLSFSSNDSNAENMPPPRLEPVNDNENGCIFNNEKHPNPRKTFSHRSPLRTINIIEVLNLPPYKYGTKEKEKLGGNLQNSFLGDMTIAPSCNTQLNNISEDTYTSTECDLFGFEDYLSQGELSDKECNESNNDKPTNVRNQTIHDKLLELGKLKPDENELKMNSEKQIKTVDLFVDNSLSKDGMRQRCIQELLCSTMVNPKPSTSKAALMQLRNEDFKSPRKSNLQDGEENQLFTDPDPETTFNENEAHRTYIQQYKRKPRLKEGKYIVFLDSDASEDEDDSCEQEKRQKLPKSKISSKHVSKKKRTRKPTQEKTELIEFVKEFNEMCKDVASYNLIVEKKTT